VLAGDVGQASGLKMCYAAMTKGLQALGAELLTAARLLGVEDTLLAEQSEGDVANVRRFVERSLLSMRPRPTAGSAKWRRSRAASRTWACLVRLMLGAADVYTNVRDGGLLATELPLKPVAR